MIKTSESVFKGHPDKICDQVADYILTKLLEQDKYARAGIECLIKDDLLVIAGEISTQAIIDYTKTAKDCLELVGLNSNEFHILEKISVQSSDIAIGVDKGGAGDQGIMYGYAEKGTDELMPLPVVLSRKLARSLDSLNKEFSTILSTFFGNDGKCHVSVEYEKNIPKKVTTVVVSIQTKPGIPRRVYEPIVLSCINEVIPKRLISNETKILINPTGEFVKGGSYADSGLTGRKLQCDSYGGLALHGGGAWSGKDFSKVDRSASYYARYIAKNIVAANLADKCEIGIAYAIGIDRPVGLSVNTFGTSLYDDNTLLRLIHNVFDFRPSSITKEIGVNDFFELASYGHVGVLVDKLPWERFDKVDILKELANDY